MSWLLTRFDARHIFNHMVKYKSADLDMVFSALGDATRRAILARLADGDSPVTELARPHDISLPAISKHLRVLEQAGLIRKKRDGRVIRCSLDPAALKTAADWVEQYRRFWDAQFDQLARYLDGSQSNMGKDR